MSRDIVRRLERAAKRLRAVRHSGGSWEGVADLLDEAAAQILELRGEVNDLQSDRKDFDWGALHALRRVSP